MGWPPSLAASCLLWFKLEDAFSKSRCSLVLRAGPGMAQLREKGREKNAFLFNGKQI